jgi:GT2 family glycosyltransferase
VVDNNSADDTVNFIKANYPEVTLLEQNKNLGFGKANNIGISLAMKNEADYVFLLNQDAWVQPDTIEKLVSAHQREPQFGILSPMHLNGK